MNYTDVIEPAHTWISSQGRMKYLMPIYQALLDNNQRDLAVQWYKENVNFYHPYSVMQLAKMIGLSETEIKSFKSAQLLSVEKEETPLFLQA
jgi:hypothetical protein